MRAPEDMPSKRRRPRGSGRARVIVLVVAAVLFVLFTSLRGLAAFYTDFLWFDSLGLSEVWSGILRSKVFLGLAFTAVFFVLCFVNLTLVDRFAPRFRPAGPEDDLLTKYHEVVDRRSGLVRAAVSLLFGLVAGVGMSAQWNEWLLFRNGGDFGVKDATFDTDVGFYVFKLPFLAAVTDWLFASVVIVLLITVVAAYLNGGVRLQAPFQRVTPAVKGHISVLLALLALIKAVDYWLGRYELTFSNRGVVDGATYTDVKAQLPATYLLLLISLLSCALFIANIWRRGWVLPVMAVGLWGFVQLVAGAAYPTFIQRVQVEPEESARESPYIVNNIEATRQALGMDDVEVKAFNYDADEVSTKQAIEANPETIRNIRLLDPQVVKPTYQNLQAFLGFYKFDDLDIDRYKVRTPDGSMDTTQVVLSARELDSATVPQKSWEGMHLAYTHGNGIALSAANATDGSGRPDFLVGGVPTQVSDKIEMTLDQPQLYFGESLGMDYTIVGTTRDEVDYVDAQGQPVVNNYSGTGGVGLDSAVRQAAFFLRFDFEWNLIFSNFVTRDSRILYVRDVQDRVETVAPFLSFDADPYPVVIGGKIVYVVDGYTTSNHYPNAQRADTDGLESGSGLKHSFNYARNSVKAVVDAYDGSVTLYVVDDSDPIVNAYAKAFPDLFEDGDAVPRELAEHFRYPEDIFKVQTNMWGRYHISEPGSFYEKNVAWAVAQDPGSVVATGPSTPNTTINPTTGASSTKFAKRVDPYYLLMKLPGEEQEGFVMLRTFVPFSEDDGRRQLEAFMVAKSDPDDYGKLVVYEVQNDELPAGPALVASAIQQDPTVAREISLLSQQGSTVTFGDLILVPVDDSLLYVRPLYVASQGQTQTPALKYVIVVWDSSDPNVGTRVVMKETLKESLEEMFGARAETFEQEVANPDPAPDPEDTTTTSTTSTTTPGGTEPGDETVESLLARVQQLTTEADQALRMQGSAGLALYAEKMAEIAELYEQINEKLAQQGQPSGPPPPETTTTTGSA